MAIVVSFNFTRGDNNDCHEGIHKKTKTDDFSPFKGGPVFIRDAQGTTLIGTLWTQRFSIQQNTNIFTAMQIGQFWDFIHDVTGIPRRWG